MIVVGVHARRLLGHTMLGSTACYLLDDPPASVLLARAAVEATGRLTVATEAALAAKA
jgi:hypothetical protein